MTTYTANVPASALHAAASLVPFGASGRDANMSPILGGVAVSVAGGTFLAIATDRYMVGEYSTTLDTDTDTFPAALIPSATLASFAKAAPRTGYATISHDDDTHTLTIEFNGNTIRGYVVTGNIPPVGQLFSEPQELSGALTLNVEMLAKLAKVKHPDTGKSFAKDYPWTFQSNADAATSRAMPPVHITATIGTHAFRALLQPNLPRR